ncbi:MULTISPECIES: hypothetical protein [unclassified Pseudodesulfovibrio]|uniref:hypothetical protein n=1 Tax=unclassified Pseudodesulfovibrio TaxID=2661612 RepID=UPI000FEBCFFC|nr:MULTISPECIES: hypothetical protein [unclassified Pseudodesulfovibrio]MCJ2163148.1 hypothetical protein [Pseudodesulfovibrio sp. S3-i]RWU07139.1 hypothetical protein DWB63_01125 [Pseudodesulfovibrio sp. S3]
MNEIRISVTLSLDEKHPEDGYIDFNLSVDGQYLHDVGVYVDPVDLVTSATMSGEFFIYTCDCGNPACQGIDEGVMVSHSKDAVTWRLRNPISWPSDEARPPWEHDAEFIFPKNHYLQQVAMALDHAKRLAKGITLSGQLWVGPALTIESLMALEAPPLDGDFFAVEPEGRALH